MFVCSNRDFGHRVFDCRGERTYAVLVAKMHQAWELNVVGHYFLNLIALGHDFPKSSALEHYFPNSIVWEHSFPDPPLVG